MATPRVDNLFYPSPDESLAIALTSVIYSYDRNNIEVNVSEGTEIFERFKAFANLASVAIANNEIALEDVSPLDAVGEALTELAGTYGVFARPASSAAGSVFVGVTGGGTVAIPQSFVGTSATGIQYSATVGGVVGDGDPIAVQSISAGAGTDLEEGDKITWDSAAIGALDQVATVAQGGITGGAAADGEEDVRRRLLIRLRAPSVGGNAAQVSDFAEGASAAVERGFVNMAVRGPSSYDVAITRPTGDRVLSSVVVNNVANTVIGQMPGSADLNATSVIPQYVDIIINTTLPLPVGAGGAGGGWRDQVPWPSTAEAVANTYAEVTAVNVVASTITVNSGAADVPAVSQRFQIWDPAPTIPVMHEFTILAVTGSAGAWVIEVDTSTSSSLGFINLSTTAYFCSASAVNLGEYASEFLAAVLTLGPGEKTSNIDKLPRALRQPGPDVEFPMNLTSLQLTAVTNAHPEILDMTYAARIVPGTSAAAAGWSGTFTPRVSPDVATIETDPPNILVLRSLSFRRQVI